MFSLDDALAEVVLGAREANLAAIKLAWWRDQLHALDVSPPPAEPRLQSIARELLPRGISGAELAGLEDGWLELLQSEPNRQALSARGELLFALAARLLGGTSADLDVAGRAWALADLARRTGSPEWLGGDFRMPSLPRKLRPLGTLAALGARDHRRGFPMEAEGTPGRSWAIARHRITGRL